MLGGYTPVEIVALIVGILIAMTIHEMSHAYVGLKLGDDTAAEQGRISFNPLRHIDPFMTVILPIITILIFQTPILAAKPVPFNPARVKYDEFGAAMIALAGPVSNFVLAFLAALLLHVVPAGSVMIGALGTFIGLNVALFVFNLVPIPPLDGSRVLYAFAPEPLQRLMAAIEPFGFFIIFGLVLFTGFRGPLLDAMQFVLNILPA